MRLMDKPQSTELVFELSRPGRRTHLLPKCDVPAPPADQPLPAAAPTDAPPPHRPRPAAAPTASHPPSAEVSENDLIRHFVNLSTRNMSIDTNFCPLGSCTMKYTPKRHERMAALSGLSDLHPLQDDATCQG